MQQSGRDSRGLGLSLADIHALNANGDRACRARPFRHARDSEDWLNDGVALALPSALGCLREWYGEDLPGRGEWRVGGQPIVPEQVAVPSLVMLPATDRIVPPLSAKALGSALPKATVLTAPLGHIGMVVARDAPKIVWGKLSEWVRGEARSPY